LTGFSSDVGPIALAASRRVLGVVDSDTIALWDLSNPARPRPLGRPLTAFPDPVESFAFAPDGRTLASSSDGVVTLWDLTDPTRPRRMGGPVTAAGQLVTQLSFTVDGHVLITGAADGTMTWWDVTGLDSLRSHATEQACALVGRGLSPTQWAQYVPGLPFREACPR
jgi:WD40 repeat protein